MNAITLIVKIGGYIIFFSIIMNCLFFIPIHDHILKDFLFGLMELANGTKLLVSTSASLPVKFVLLSTLVAFGTFSVHAQTASVIHHTGLKNKTLYYSKINKCCNNIYYSTFNHSIIIGFFYYCSFFSYFFFFTFLSCKS